MKSLRLQLIVGSALIAIVPLGMAIQFLSFHVRSIVREQAEARLDETLGGLHAWLRADLNRIEQKLAILARDPELRRLYLVGGNERALVDYLDERRVLLSLDFIHVVDNAGTFHGDGPRTADPSALGVPRAYALARHDTTPGLRFVTDGRTWRLTLGSYATIEYQGERAGTLRGGVAIDAEYLARARVGSGVELVVFDPGDTPVASTLGSVFVRWKRYSEGPRTSGVANATSEEPPREPIHSVYEVSGRTYWGQSMVPFIGSDPQPRMLALVSTASADRTIGVLQQTALVLALAGVALAIGLGFLWARLVSRPVERLAADSRRLARGEWDAPIVTRGAGELRTLVESLDRMRIDLVDYRQRLVASERHSAWSRMARAVAHEIKNPLTPIAVSVADLRRSYELGRPEFPAILDQAARTVAEEVDRLQRILHEFSQLGRFPDPVPASVRVETLLAALRTLYAGEVEADRLDVTAPADPELTVWADEGQLRQALVNLIQNALDAVGSVGTRGESTDATAPASIAEPPGAGSAHVNVSAAGGDGEVAITVADDGPGLSFAQRQHVFEPGFTTKPHGGGLGLTIVERIVLDHGGTIDVDSAPGRGTKFTIRLPREPRS